MVENNFLNAIQKHNHKLNHMLQLFSAQI